MAKNDDTEKSESKKGLEKPLKKPPTFDHLKSKKKPHYSEVAILMDPEIGVKHDELTQELLKLEKRKLSLSSRKGQDKEKDLEKLLSDIEDLEDQITEAEKDMYDASVVFKFKSTGRRKMDDLLTENTPTGRQIEEAKQAGNPDLQYNPDTFPQALIAESCVDPELSKEEVQDLWEDDSWTTPELLALFTGAQDANQDFRVLDPKKGFGQT